ncbi:MAG TPA: hypothetical protein VMG09_11985 [Bacteroidota bacterium]|nr:hypothetical protein [Bacteroidota bacterium]
MKRTSDNQQEELELREDDCTLEEGMHVPVVLAFQCHHNRTSHKYGPESEHL